MAQTLVGSALARALGVRHAPLMRCLPSRHLAARAAASAAAGFGAAPAAAAAPGAGRRPRRAPAPSIYDAPEHYELAFGFRDLDREAAFLGEAYAAHRGGAASAAPAVLLDVGCGPGGHLLRLAAAWPAARAVGLDASAPMLAHAARAAAAAGVRAQFVRADMAAELGAWAAAAAEGAAPGSPPALPDGSVHLALVLLGTLCHCLDNAAAVRCLSNVAAALAHGGVLVLELPHPGDLFFQDPDDGSALSDAWEHTDAATGASASVEFGRPDDEFCAATQVLRRTVGVCVVGADGRVLFDGLETVPQRLFGLPEVELLGRAAGLRLAAVRGDFDASVPLVGHDDAHRLVAVLVKD